MLKKNYDWLLLYDGNCPVCANFAQIITKMDNGKIYALDLAFYDGQFGEFCAEELLSDVHLLGKNGEILVGGDAVQKILTVLPQTKPFTWMLESRWGTKGSHKVYASLKKYHRRCSSCDQ